MGLLYDVLVGFLGQDTARHGSGEFFLRWHMVPIGQDGEDCDQYALQHVELDYGGAETENKITLYTWQTISCVMGEPTHPSGLVVDGGENAKRDLVNFSRRELVLDMS